MLSIEYEDNPDEILKTVAGIYHFLFTCCDGKIQLLGTDRYRIWVEIAPTLIISLVDKN